MPTDTPVNLSDGACSRISTFLAFNHLEELSFAR